MFGQALLQDDGEIDVVTMLTDDEVREALRELAEPDAMH